MSKRLRNAAFGAAISLIGFSIAALIALAGGSTYVAYWVVVISTAVLFFAVIEILDLERWLKRATPKQQWIYLGATLILFLGAVVAYLVWQSVALWYLAPVASIPLWYFLVARGDDQGDADGGSGFPPTPP
jgi:NADH:ubiquinone oxidoreductase subunit 6 (subunit J)